MSHTPGPWLATEGHPSDVWHVDMRARHFSVTVSRSDADHYMPVEEVQANARLIAAAPELLQVLERCNNRWDDADEEDNPALGQAIRAAIAKATGKE